MFSSSSTIILTNSESSPHQKTEKEILEEKNRKREERLEKYFDKLTSKFKVGDVLLIKRHNDEECCLLYKDMYKKREYDEMYIIVPVVMIERYASNAHINNCRTVYELFDDNDYKISKATNDDIIRCSKKYLKQQIDSRKQAIRFTKEEIRNLKHSFSSIDKNVDNLIIELIESTQKNV